MKLNNELELALFVANELLKRKTNAQEEHEETEERVRQIAAEIEDLDKKQIEVAKYLRGFGSRTSLVKDLDENATLGQIVSAIEERTKTPIDQTNVIFFSNLHDKKGLDDELNLPGNENSYEATRSEMKQFLDSLEFKIRVTEAISSLREVEQQAIKHRILGQKIYSDIGSELGRSGEFARYTFHRAIRKLKHPSRSRRLRKIISQMSDECEKQNWNKVTLSRVALHNFSFEALLICNIFGGKELYYLMV